ncbi:anthranilate synthase component 1 [Deinobacterium chartae]|uniref:Anthranilate synthase component 1 n=1 Tax=Deinobacterium chartae TaxID=521158 RepID=A0A841HYK0_9DEIO|nr:anthranilate synthase component I [Deinobacterium chartae]MBB6097956.1 anthranilate synthase component 1 [Deinobacterium chartae]
MRVHYREMTADLETPVSAYLKVAQGQSVSFLLESVEGGERNARYSFIGVGARGRMVARGQRVTLEGSFGEGTREVSDPLELLYSAVVRETAIPEPLPAFVGGAVGYTSYDLIRLYERLPEQNPDELNLPDVLFVSPRAMVIFDHVKHRLFLTALSEGEHEDALAESALQDLERRLRGPLPGVPGDRPAPHAEFRSNFTREGFEAAVERCLEYIRAGDIFQVVPSQRFSAPLTTHPFAIYRALRSVNPSPYLGYLDLGEVTLVASSPESLLKSDGREVVTRPIAGTRRRGRTAEEDRALEAELLADEKERAEHLMLVDLGRNDIGRVARFGSVRVEDAFSIERYSHVMHIVSGVRGTLAENRTPLHALASVLPMGTVSGAPKIRAMEIIEEIEPARRGPYGGAFGYIAPNGSLDMALTLRTMVVAHGQVHIQAGGGVVADSKPADEYQESLNKAAALMRAVELAEAGL